MNFDPNLRTGIVYADAESRGRVRAWKKRLADQYMEFVAGFRVLDEECDDFIKRSAKGRARALAKIKRLLGAGATLEHVRLDGKEPFAIWSILKPRNTMTVRPSPSATEAERRSLGQDAVTVNCIAAGWLPGDVGRIIEGAWTIEVPDHALGRAVQYSGYIHPGVIIREAHLNLLWAPVSLTERSEFADPTRGVLLKAGAGAFFVHMRTTRDISLGSARSVSYRAPSWLDDNRMRDDQIPFAERGQPGDRMGDGWAAPAIFRRFTKIGAAFQSFALPWWR